MNAEAAKTRFDGTVLGWRIAPDSVLDAEGIDGRNLSRTCDPKPVGAETPTQLDFTLTYFPSEIKIEAVSGPDKWICDAEGLSVAYDYSINTPYGAGNLWVERSVRGSRALGLDVPSDRVEAGTINGKPALFIHPADDASGLGIGRVIVIEQDTEPEFTILRVTVDDGIPFTELIKIAEGVK